ncbi:hypothetical protein A4A49_55853, partial [Nicotiana attenuata]
LLTSKKTIYNKVIRLNVKWERPLKGWLKVNIDRAFNSNNLEGGISVVVRDSKGKWMSGFLKKIQATSPLQTELQDLLHALQLIIKEQLFPVDVETDATEVVRVISEDYPTNNVLIYKCRLLVEEASRQGTISFRHSFRKGNMVAHVLAKAALMETSYNNLCTFVLPPEHVV